MERSDLICECSCSFNDHYLDSICKNYYDEEEDYLGPCNCLVFKLDNLKYLEMLSKEKEVADL